MFTRVWYFVLCVVLSCLVLSCLVTNAAGPSHATLTLQLEGRWTNQALLIFHQACSAAGWRPSQRDET